MVYFPPKSGGLVECHHEQDNAERIVSKISQQSMGDSENDLRWTMRFVFEFFPRRGARERIRAISCQNLKGTATNMKGANCSRRATMGDHVDVPLRNPPINGNYGIVTEKMS
jgi:hypothetical protein